MRYRVPPYLISLFFTLMHPGIIAAMVLSGTEWELRGMVGDVVFASIYLPLLIPEAIGLTTLQDTPAIFSPPNVIGWLFILAAWFVAYFLIALLIVKVRRVLAS